MEIGIEDAFIIARLVSFKSDKGLIFSVTLIGVLLYFSERFC